MLDSDLAALYGIETKALNQAIKRNIERFSNDFMFQLTREEWTNMRSQFVTACWGGRRNEPYVFTEHGEDKRLTEEFVRCSQIANSEQKSRKATTRLAYIVDL